MRLACIHCGKYFTITAEQLGGRGHCPHCNGEIQLPAAEAHVPAADRKTGEPIRWLENSISTLVSIIFHTVLVLILALVSYGGSGLEGVGEEVLIGALPSEQLNETAEQELSTEEAAPEETADELEETLEMEPPVDSSADTADTDLRVNSPSATGDSGSFDLGSVAIGGGSVAGGSWDGMLQNLRRYGLDIVIAFDSTGSMGGEIREVKKQIERIGSNLMKLVPKARISICTYRDEGDDYIVRGLPLSGDIYEVVNYLSAITADGGGDHPEAVHEGLRWSVQENDFRTRARKVILLFGDAPPHPQQLANCLRIASDFNRQSDGVVSTVTCRSARRIPAFIQIAQVGGGEAFLTTDERQIMTQLMVLVFGSRHRSKVLEALELMDR